MTTPHLAVLYEHPDWFKPLFSELERRAIPHVPIYAGELSYDPAVGSSRENVQVTNWSILEARACSAAMKRDLQRNETACNEHRANVGREFFAWACHGFSTTASAAMKPTRVTNALAVLLLLTPLLCGQTLDELLVVRLPAKHGYINQPGATPIPFPTARGQTARRCGSMAAGCSEGWRGNACPGQAVGESKLGRQAVPLAGCGAGATQAGRDAGAAHLRAGARPRGSQ